MVPFLQLMKNPWELELCCAEMMFLWPRCCSNEGKSRQCCYSDPEMLISGDSRDWRCQHGSAPAFHGGWSMFTALLLQQPLQFSARSGTDACLHRDLLSCFWKRKENGNYDNRQTCGMRRRKQASRKPTVVHWGQASCFPCYPILT